VRTRTRTYRLYDSDSTSSPPSLDSSLTSTNFESHSAHCILGRFGPSGPGQRSPGSYSPSTFRRKYSPSTTTVSTLRPAKLTNRANFCCWDGRGAFLRDELRESAFPRVLSSRWHMARRFLQVQAPGVIPFILGAIIMLLGVVAPLGYMVYKNRKVFQRQTDRKL
jgi:hypothetical protein